MNSVISNDQKNAAQSWVRNNTWFQKFQTQLIGGVQANQASLLAQDETWPSRKNCMKSEELELAAEGLLGFYKSIKDFFSSSAVFPINDVSSLHRGHAIPNSLFETFIENKGNLENPLFLSYSIDSAFVPYYYASHNYRKIESQGSSEDIIPYILHVTLAQRPQPFFWITKEAATQKYRDDCWQYEAIVPPTFEIEISEILDENIDGTIIKHIYAEQK